MKKRAVMLAMLISTAVWMTACGNKETSSSADSKQASTAAPATSAPAQTAPAPATPAPAQTAPAPATPAPAQTAPAPATPAPAQIAPAPATSAPAATTASVKAEEIYKASCMSCHGANLEGRPGPNLQKIGSTKTKEQIFTQISKGSNRMPGFEKMIEAADIEVLAAWLAEKK